MIGEARNSLRMYNEAIGRNDLNTLDKILAFYQDSFFKEPAGLKKLLGVGWGGDYTLCAAHCLPVLSTQIGTADLEVMRAAPQIRRTEDLHFFLGFGTHYGFLPCFFIFLMVLLVA